ncbi:unnamed protein product, partial [Rangifer tarandus platyrhynchus]
NADNGALEAFPYLTMLPIARKLPPESTSAPAFIAEYLPSDTAIPQANSTPSAVSRFPSLLSATLSPSSSAGVFLQDRKHANTTEGGGSTPVTSTLIQQAQTDQEVPRQHENTTEGGATQGMNPQRLVQQQEPQQLLTLLSLQQRLASRQEPTAGGAQVNVDSAEEEVQLEASCACYDPADEPCTAEEAYDSLMDLASFLKEPLCSDSPSTAAAFFSITNLQGTADASRYFAARGLGRVHCPQPGFERGAVDEATRKHVPVVTFSKFRDLADLNQFCQDGLPQWQQTPPARVTVYQVHLRTGSVMNASRQTHPHAALTDEISSPRHVGASTRDGTPETACASSDFAVVQPVAYLAVVRLLKRDYGAVKPLLMLHCRPPQRPYNSFGPVRSRDCIAPRYCTIVRMYSVILMGACECPFGGSPLRLRGGPSFRADLECAGGRRYATPTPAYGSQPKIDLPFMCTSRGFERLSDEETIDCSSTLGYYVFCAGDTPDDETSTLLPGEHGGSEDAAQFLEQAA